jgi:REP element-mobilizing transposase RayT
VERPVRFSRKVSVRAIGHNTSEVVRSYVQDQLQHVDLADSRYRASFAAAAFENPSLDLAQPAETQSGRYWYNLHLVLVTANRYRIGEALFLRRIRDAAMTGLGKAGCAVYSLAIMPDHLHAAIRGEPVTAPLETGVILQNATAEAAGCRLWQEAFYVGTFSEYTWKALT